MRGTDRLFALLLPLLGLAGVWSLSEYRSHQGSDWEVPVAGYDPRDLLRGHYVLFRYDWPGGERFESGLLSRFCIEGRPPRIERIVPVPDDDRCRFLAEARGVNLQPGSGLWQGRLYVPQARAAELEAKLRDPNLRALVVIRLREDGLVTPRELRFRPLTAQERLSRDAESAPGGTPALQ